MVRSSLVRSMALAVGVWLVLGVSSVRANDIVGMPIATMSAPGTVAANVIYWDQDFPAPAVAAGAPENILVYEAYYTVNDRVEVNAISFHPDQNDSFTFLNAAVALVKEKPGKPGVTLGAYNLSKEDFDPSPAEQDDISPYLATVCNVRAPKQGPPSLSDPVVRLHLGYGTDFHANKPDGGRFFGGAQVLLAPTVGVAALNYQSNPSYMVTLMPAKPKGLEVTLGTISGDKFARVGYSFNLSAFGNPGEQ